MKKIYKVEKSIYYNAKFKHYVLMLYTETERGFGWGKVFEGTYSECMDEKNKLLNEKVKVKRK